MHQNPINNDSQNANIKPALLELSQFKLALIITILCVLFFLIIQHKARLMLKSLNLKELISTNFPHMDEFFLRLK